MNTKVLMMAAVMMTAVACERGFNQNPPELTKPAAKVEPAAADPCPSKIEGLWNIHIVETTSTPETEDGVKTTVESFGVGRNSAGVLQLSFANLSEPVVLDGNTRDIRGKSNGTITDESATYTGKCVDGKILVTEKTQSVDDSNLTSENEKTMEFQMSQESGSQIVRKNGKVQSTNLMTKNLSPATQPDIQ